MSEAVETPQQKRRSRRVYILWAVALTLLLTAGLLCWKMVVPFMQARHLVENHPDKWVEGVASSGGYCFAPQWSDYTQVIDAHGGPRRASRLLMVYLNAPAAVAPRKDRACELLVYCGSTASADIARALKHPHREVRSRAFGAFTQRSALWRERFDDPRIVQALEHFSIE